MWVQEAEVARCTRPRGGGEREFVSIPTMPVVGLLREAEVTKDRFVSRQLEANDSSVSLCLGFHHPLS